MQYLRFFYITHRNPKYFPPFSYLSSKDVQEGGRWKNGAPPLAGDRLWTHWPNVYPESHSLWMNPRLRDPTGGPALNLCQRPLMASEATGTLQHSWIYRNPFGTTSNRLVSRLMPNYPNCFRMSGGLSVPTIDSDLCLCFWPHICSLSLWGRPPLWFS